MGYQKQFENRGSVSQRRHWRYRVDKISQSGPKISIAGAHLEWYIDLQAKM